MFAYCNLLFEIMPTGSVFTSYRISPVTVFDSSQDLFSMSTICALIYLVLIFLLAFRQIFAIKTMKNKYFTNVWSYGDLSLIAFSFTAFAIWLYRLWEAQRVMTQTSSYSSSSSTGQSNRYVNLQMLAYWDDILSSMLAICSFIATIKFLHILQFNSTIRTLFRTMSICASELVSFGIIFLITVFAFIQAGYVIFNDSILGLSTFFKSVETGFLLMLGKFALSQMLLANPACSVIFYMTFNIFVMMILLNMFITMISDAFERAKDEEKDGDPLGLENYLYEKMAKFFGSKKKAENEDKGQLNREDQKTMASLGQHGMYMEQTEQFDYKTTQLVTVLKLVKFLNVIIFFNIFLIKTFFL
jgi:hypothetical protein